MTILYNPKNNYPQLVEKQKFFFLHFYSQSGYRASMYKTCCSPIYVHDYNIESGNRDKNRIFLSASG